MTDIRDLLVDSLDRVMTKCVTTDLLASAETGRFPDDAWAAIEGLQLHEALPRVSGDLDMGWSGFQAVAEAAGRHALPLPLIEHLLARWFCLAAGAECPEGLLTVIPDASALAIAGDTVGGTAGMVPWGGRADHAVAVIGDDEHAMLAVLPLRHARVEPMRNMAGEPRARVSFDGVEPLLLVSLDAGLGAGRLHQLGAACRAAQTTGAIEAILLLTREHAATRHQFGRPLAAFQAIQNHMVAIAGELAAMAAATTVAFRVMDAGTDIFLPVAVAKARADVAAERVAMSSHQVHGAIGVSAEYRLQFLTRRLWAWRSEFGTGQSWREEIGRLVLARGNGALRDLVARG